MRKNQQDQLPRAPELSRGPHYEGRRIDTSAPVPTRKRATVAAAVIAATVAVVAVVEPSAPADALGAVLTWAAALIGL